MRRTLIAAAILSISCFTQTVRLSGQEANIAPVVPGVASAMRKFSEDKEIAGSVTLVATANAIQHLYVDGFADLASKRPLREDSIFWIASMTKPMTGVCVMILVEEGKLSLDAPISDYLPEMKNLKLEDGSPAVITLRHLLTHTSGMAELAGSEAYSSKTLAEAAAKYAKVKVLFTPGSKWQYSQTSINTAARIVEVVSGVRFDQFLEDRVCKPLGMKDTTFYLSEEQMTRVAKSYKRTENGNLEEAANLILAGRAPTDRNRMPAANGGLFSTARDYSRFCQMLIQDGTLDGARILSPESVLTFRTPSTGQLTTGFTPGNAWAIGCCVIRDPSDVTAMLSPGSFGHGGAHGTQAWIDPVQGRCYILMTQRANFPNSDASNVRKEFQSEAVKGLEKFEVRN
jgi:CubicO group peptidase (beta-lactamase class C family)